MSDLGRDGLAQVFGSPDYMRWASRIGNMIDARKLAAEFAGTHRPTCGSEFARGLQKLCRAHPPLPTEPPPSPLTAVWQADAIYTTTLGNFDGLRRDPAKAAGFKVVYVQLGSHALHAAENEQHIALMVSEGWTVCGWCTYGQDDADPYQDGLEAAAISRRLTVLRGWKANGEAWAEWGLSWKTSAFLRGWRDGGGNIPLGWSVLSSDTANYGRAFDYPTALSVAGADIDIQVYGATHPTYTVAAGLGMLRNTPVPITRTTMTFDLTQDGRGPFPDYRTWPGPRRLWIGEWTTADTYRQLAR